MNSIAIDIGNSFAKYAIFSQGQCAGQGMLKNSRELSRLLGQWAPGKAISCSVGRGGGMARLLDEKLKGAHIRLCHNTPLPITNAYGAPAQLGPDRLAAAVGAAMRFPGEACLIIDAGTALTIDLLAPPKRYLGGSISPGAELRFRALHEHTSRLPRQKATSNYSYGGRDTAEAITNGVMQGMLAEMEAHRAHYEKKYPNIRLVLTGGSAKYFENKLKSPIFAEPELVLQGLNHILDHNATI